MKLRYKTATCYLAAIGLLAGCALPSQSHYGYQDVGQASTVEFGRIVAVREVDITGRNTGLGAGAGVAAGAIGGSYIGRGNGSIAGLLAGAIIGGVAGAVAEQAVADRKGVQYVITERNRKTVTIVQNIAKDDEPLHKGQRVMIQTSGSYQRVLPADDLPTKVKLPEGIDVTK